MPVTRILFPGQRWGADRSGHKRPKCEEQKPEQSEKEDGVVRVNILAGDETAETEVEFRPPRGTNRMPDNRPIITGPSQRRRTSVIRDRQTVSGPRVGLNRNGQSLSCRFRKLRDHTGYHREGENSQKSREPTSSPKCRPQHIRDPVDSRQVPGQGR